MIRISAGTAACMGLKKVKTHVSPTTAYLLSGDQCIMNCSFCPQSDSSDGKSSNLGRINWPLFSREHLMAGLQDAPSTGLKRICLQGVREKGGIESLLDMTREIKKHSSLPLCVSAWVEDTSEAMKLFAAGADKVSIALDAANEEIYARLKGGSFKKRLDLLLRCARLKPKRIATHIIIGLGETEEEALSLINSLFKEKVTVALFAFTPLKGTAMQQHPAPDLRMYRRIQAASFLMQEGRVDYHSLTFKKGSLHSFGQPHHRIKSLLHGGRAFETRGCPDCNRPYYNERPGSVLYNYPRPLTPKEEKAALNCLENAGEEGGEDCAGNMAPHP